MQYLKIIISYNCEEDKRVVGLISKKINRILKKFKNKFNVETMIIKCHRKKNDTIFIQPTHGKMDLELSECYQELLKLYIKATECKSIFSSFMSRVKLGCVQIKI